MTDDHYRALHGRKPAFVEALLQMDCGYFGETTKHNLAFFDILNPVDSGFVDLDEGLPWVEGLPTCLRYKIIDIHHIGGAAQLVLLNPGSGTQTVERDSRRWVVNSRIVWNSFG